MRVNNPTHCKTNQYKKKTEAVLGLTIIKTGYWKLSCKLKHGNSHPISPLEPTGLNGGFCFLTYSSTWNGMCPFPCSISPAKKKRFLHIPWSTFPAGHKAMGFEGRGWGLAPVHSCPWDPTHLSPLGCSELYERTHTYTRETIPSSPAKVTGAVQLAPNLRQCLYTLAKRGWARAPLLFFYRRVGGSVS